MPNCLRGVVGANWRIILKKIVKVEQLIELAMEVETKDSLPWHLVNIAPDTAYGMMAAHVVDMFENQDNTNKELVMMSVMTKLLVENFLLQAKIAQDNS